MSEPLSPNPFATSAGADDSPGALWRQHAFLRMWVSRLMATGGTQMLMVAIGWRMYELTSSAWDLGLVGLFQFAPALLLALPAGHVVDQHHRGRVAGICLAVLAAVALLLAAAHGLGRDSRALLLGTSLVLGAVRAFLMPAQQALTPTLVPPHPPSRSTCSRCCWAARWRCCRSSRATSCTQTPGAWACCAARRPWALAMSLWLMRTPLRDGVGRTLLLAVGLFGLCMVVFGLSRSFWLSLGVLAISGAADMVSVVIRQTLVQLDTPDAMRGRVAAVNSIFIGASNQLGEFESGATAALLGPVGATVMGGVGTMMVALLWVRVFPALASRDRLDAER